MQGITNCLWFDFQAEEAALFYTSIFNNSKIGKIARYTNEGFEFHQKPDGSVMTIEFELNGQNFLGLNGGPVFKFTEAISFVIYCQTQEEINHYWDKLSEGGDPNAQQCGWLKDKFGVSWQIVPTQLPNLMAGKNGEKVTRVLFQMKKLEIAKLIEASDD
ncbi:MAG: 3-demethylubiquinone-9 3-methyltransferase [Ignavibacteria bacterium]|nr:MAG: 3-demethylubiquinone-9 3-methyltransferase [Ignavibacteria bacterium]KAF0161372.1 MAG: 3-demethylubiquinone-9 3-methyltransferase [Ignavibacteria bacterium]